MSLTDVLRTVLVRRRGTALPVFFVFVLVAAGLVAVLPKRYEASASLFVGQDRPISASGSAQRDDVLAKSYAELLKAPEVAQQAATTVGGGLSRTDLANRMHFLVTPGTQLISVTASDENAARAARLATVYAETFIAQRQRNDARLRTARLDRLDQDISALSRRVERLRAQGEASQPALSDAAARLTSLRATYQALDESLVLEGSNLSLATRAVAPAAPSAPRPVLYMAAAVLLGLFAATGAALARDRLDRRLWTEDDVRAITGAPVLGRIPKRRGSDDIMFREAFDFLRTNLMSRSKPRTVLVTSASGSNGKTTISTGLARSLAEAGKAVIAVDCDFHNAALSRPYRHRVSAGVQAVATGSAALAQAVVSTDDPNLRIAVAGEDDPHTRLEPSAAARLVATLSRDADILVLDTAPVTAAVETSVLAGADVDAVLLVVDLRTVRREALMAAVDQLALGGVQPVGIVINRSKAPDAYAYGPRARHALPTAKRRRLASKR